jgi:hypothetical protein
MMFLLKSVEVGRADARFARAKQVLRCAQNDNQKARAKAKEEADSLRE